MTPDQPTVTFSNGTVAPSLGFGTWQLDASIAPQLIRDVIAAGYRHIDCAEVYGNEEQVGQGLKMAFDEGLVKREDLWITSKLWNTNHREKDFQEAIANTLKNLGLDYLDLYLIHWPIHALKTNSRTIDPEPTFPGVWKLMESLVADGRVKSIGVSNFSIDQVREVYDSATIKPIVNQVESHPMWNQFALENGLKEMNVQITAYSPLAANDPQAPNLKESKEVVSIAKKHNVTPIQVLIRWQIDIGRTVIPKTSTIERAKQNFETLNFKLDEEDIKTLNSFPIQHRTLNPQDFHGRPGPFFKD